MILDLKNTVQPETTKKGKKKSHDQPDSLRTWLPRSANLDNKLPKASSWEVNDSGHEKHSAAWNGFCTESQMSHLWRSNVHACINSLTNEPSVAKQRARAHYFTHEIKFYFFLKTEKFWPAGLEQQKISRSGLIIKNNGVTMGAGQVPP